MNKRRIRMCREEFKRINKKRVITKKIKYLKYFFF